MSGEGHQDALATHPPGVPLSPPEGQQEKGKEDKMVLERRQEGRESALCARVRWRKGEEVRVCGGVGV